MERDEGHEHFFHTDASVLEGVFVVGDVIVVIVGIGKERVSAGKDVACAHVGRRKPGFLRLSDGERLLRIVVQILA